MEIRLELTIFSVKVIDTLEWLGLIGGLPAYLRSDNAGGQVSVADRFSQQGIHKIFNRIDVPTYGTSSKLESLVRKPRASGQFPPLYGCSASMVAL